MQNSKPITQYRQELKGKILKEALHKFCNYGIKNVKMDTIAHDLSISKRTLYELYTDKESLLIECVKYIHTLFKQNLDKFVSKNGDNVIKILVDAFQFQLQMQEKITYSFHTDLQKYKTVLKYFDDLHKSEMQKALDFFQKGVEQGYFRDNINYELSMLIFDQNKKTVIVKKLYDEYGMNAIFNSMVLVIIRGFCTVKGVTALDEELNKMKNGELPFDPIDF